MGNLAADHVKIKEVMAHIKIGEYFIPKFQRDFVWDHEKVTALLHSIEYNFPIGVILLAESSNSPISTRNEIIQLISNNRKRNNGRIVVDGQQRLTAISIIYYAIELSDGISNFCVSKKVEKVIKNVTGKICLFKDLFYNQADLVKKFQDEIGYDYKTATFEANKYLICLSSISNKVKEKLDSFMIHIHTLSGWTNADIINIFIAINQKTRPLTHVDLMNGSITNITKDEFDLLKKILDANKSWKDWGEVSNELFVQLIKIYSDIKISNLKKVNYKTDELVNWASDKEKVESYVNLYKNFLDIFNQTRKDLKENSDIYTLSFLPKEGYLLTIFALNCSSIKGDRDNLEKYNRVICHVSRRLVNNDYASSPNAKVMDDINNFVIPVSNGSQPDEDWIKSLNLNNWEDNLRNNFNELSYKNKNSALFKLVFATIASKRPKNLFKHGQVTVDSVQESDIHHLFPLNSTKSKDLNLKDKLNRIGNLSLLRKDENQKEISNKNFDEYMKRSIKFHGANFDDVLISHYYDPQDVKEFIELLDGSNCISNKLEIILKLEELFESREKKIISDIRIKFFGMK